MIGVRRFGFGERLRGGLLRGRLRVSRGALLLPFRRGRELGEHRSLARGLLAVVRVFSRGREGRFELDGGGGVSLRRRRRRRFFQLRPRPPRSLSLSLLDVRRVLRLEVFEHAAALLLHRGELLGDRGRGRSLGVGSGGVRSRRRLLRRASLLRGSSALVGELDGGGGGPLRGARGVHRALTRGF